MRIERLRLKNFKVFRDVSLENLPPFCVFVGANGSGKTTLFEVFGFLRDALVHNVRHALSRRGGFRDPFIARYVSDGTIKMFAYLLLLNDPKPHPLLCIEEPENQLYPHLLLELCEEFRMYAEAGGQVFVSSHSPDFLDAVRIHEVFWLEKQGGYSHVRRAKDDELLCNLAAEGDPLGALWKQRLLGGKLFPC